MSIPADLGRGAVDLSEVKANAEARERAEQALRNQQEYEEAVVRAATWESGMRRTFKGIRSAPARRYALARSLAREDAQDA